MSFNDNVRRLFGGDSTDDDSTSSASESSLPLPPVKTNTVFSLETRVFKIDSTVSASGFTELAIHLSLNPGHTADNQREFECTFGGLSVEVYEVIRSTDTITLRTAFPDSMPVRSAKTVALQWTSASSGRRSLELNVQNMNRKR